MRKNAEIKDIKDAMVRMIKGEVFFYDGLELRSTIDRVYQGHSPFVAIDRNSPYFTLLICSAWDHVKEWTVDVKWEECL